MLIARKFLRSTLLIIAAFILDPVFIQGQTTATIETGNNTSGNAQFGSQSNGNVAAGNVSKLPIASLLYPGATTKIYVRFMPWFGDQKHYPVGYQSDDAGQVKRQISDMMSRGISGAFIAWYGRQDKFKDRVASQFMRESEASGFQFALSFSGSMDHCAKDPGCDVSEALVSDINYANSNYMHSSSYLRVNGRPLFFIFDLTKYNIDWNRVRNEAQGQPLLMFRNSGGFNHAQSGGAYAWLAPEGSKPNDPASLQYLDRFYTAAQQNSRMVQIGSAYKGFDDSQASWGKGRQVPQQCGQTWLSSLAEAGRFYSQRNQLPMLLVVTWNDYEEGTEMETGIDNCASVSASVSGTKLTWKLNGQENTIDHFTIFQSSQSNRLTALLDFPAHARSFDLTGSIDGLLYVKAVGRAGILNQMSNAVQWNGVK